MGIAVTLTYAAWLSAYPEFTTTVSADAFQSSVDPDLGIYPLAQDYVRNDGSGPVSSSGTQKRLLGLMCAHIAQLQYGSSNQAARNPTMVGRLSDASEGSVSAKVDMPPAGNPTQAWLEQTQYGAELWNATAPYRTARYVSAPRRRFNPWPNQ